MNLSDLPDDWQEMPYPLSTQEVGTAFLESREALILLVPSVAIGIPECNVAVVNPLHPDIAKIQRQTIIRPVYSERMFKGLIVE